MVKDLNSVCLWSRDGSVDKASNHLFNAFQQLETGVACLPFLPLSIGVPVSARLESFHSIESCGFFLNFLLMKIRDGSVAQIPTICIISQMPILSEILRRANWRKTRKTFCETEASEEISSELEVFQLRGVAGVSDAAAIWRSIK